MIGAVRRSIREPERSEQKTHRGCGNEAAAEDYMEESGQTRAARILPDFSDYEEAKALGILDEMLEGKKSIVILGHVNPDGDCIGSCLGLYTDIFFMFSIRFRVFECIVADGKDEE